jgi:hypothetical protein
VRNDSELFKMRGPLANLQRGLADGAISHEKEGRP